MFLSKDKCVGKYILYKYLGNCRVKIWILEYYATDSYNQGIAFLASTDTNVSADNACNVPIFLWSVSIPQYTICSNTSKQDVFNSSYSIEDISLYPMFEYLVKGDTALWASP